MRFSPPNPIASETQKHPSKQQWLVAASKQCSKPRELLIRHLAISTGSLKIYDYKTQPRRTDLVNWHMYNAQGSANIQTVSETANPFSMKLRTRKQPTANSVKILGQHWPAGFRSRTLGAPTVERVKIPCGASRTL